MRLTVIVPATDGPATLARCLEAIRQAEEAPDEVIAVTEPAPLGPAAARNLGAARARGDVLVFVDADVVVHRDAFRRVRERLADGWLDGVFGSYDDAPAAPGVVSQTRNLLHHHVHQRAAGPVGSFWAGLGALRREAFEACGGFDAARYPAPSIEDVELGARLAEAGRTVELDAALLGTHLKAWTLGGMLRTDLLGRGAPWVELALERRALPAELNLGWRHRLSALLTVVLAGGLARRRPGASLAAAGALAALNEDFYRLLARRLGAARAPAAMGVHLLHHLTAVAAIPVGVVRFAAAPGRPGRRPGRR